MKQAVIQVFVYFLLMSGALQAQRQQGMGQGRDHIESQRIAYITRELSLTPDEAMRFWPVYNEFNDRRFKMMNNHRQQRMETNDLGSLSEKQLLKIAEQDIANMEEMTALRRQYHQKFLEVLPVIKVIRLYEAERNFNRDLFREERGRMGRGRN